MLRDRIMGALARWVDRDDRGYVGPRHPGFVPLISASRTVVDERWSPVPRLPRPLPAHQRGSVQRSCSMDEGLG